MPAGGGYIYGPVTGAADIAGTSFLKRLKRTDLAAKIVHLTVIGLQWVGKLVLEALVFEITFFLGNPFMQSHMRRDYKLVF